MRTRLFIFAGGGSGGHLYPGLAVAQVLQATDPANRILFLTTERPIDSDILSNHNFEYHSQPIQPLPRSFFTGITFLHYWRQTLRQCRRFIAEKKPNVVLGLGGYAAPAAMYVAAKRNIPVTMLNPDSLPGKANRFGAKFAQKIFLQWPDTAKYFKDPQRCVTTGCPIRQDIFQIDRSEAIRQLGLATDRKTLVIMGGSLGGHNVNEAVIACLTECRKKIHDWQFLHLTGKEDHQKVKEGYQKLRWPAQALAFTDNMSAVLACCDLVVARAGASTLAELTAKGLPSILLPYPYHKDKHQLHNARILERGGAAKVVEDLCDSEKTAKNLVPILLGGMTDEPQRRKMALAADQIGRTEAAREIACELEILATNRYNAASMD